MRPACSCLTKSMRSGKLFAENDALVLARVTGGDNGSVCFGCLRSSSVHCVERNRLEYNDRHLSAGCGTRLGPYHLVARLGAGGMGEVYLAEDPRLGRNLAIKLLPREIDQNTQRRDMFISEAKAASALNHPNIITVYEIDQADGAYFI